MQIRLSIITLMLVTGFAVSAAERTSIVDNYNAHVDEMNAVASEYNQQVRIFKGNE